MRVQITPGFPHPPDSERIAAFPGLEGGLRVTVDGTPVTGSGDSAVWHDPLLGPDGSPLDIPPAEFSGEDIALSIESVEAALEPFIEGRADRHREYTAELFGEPGLTLLAILRLDNKHVRLAALPRRLDQSVNPTLSAQVGFATTPESIATALADCIETCLEFTRHAYVVSERHADFEPEYEELRSDYEQKISTLRDFANSS